MHEFISIRLADSQIADLCVCVRLCVCASLCFVVRLVRCNADHMLRCRDRGLAQFDGYLLMNHREDYAHCMNLGQLQQILASCLHKLASIFLGSAS